MEEDIFSGIAKGTRMDSKILQTFQIKFLHVQSILDQNKMLIHEINQNHQAKIPAGLSRNVRLIRELNNNIKKVVELYAELSNDCAKSIEASSEGD